MAYRGPLPRRLLPAGYTGSNAQSWKSEPLVDLWAYGVGPLPRMNRTEPCQLESQPRLPDRSEAADRSLESTVADPSGHPS